jgi:hypothetical protein
VADSISAIPQQQQLGRLAQFLRYLETESPEFLPRQLDVMGIMRQLALPSSQTVENLSYGNSPFTMPPQGTGAMIPQVKTGRKPEVADLIGMISGVPGGKAVIDSGTKISQDALNAYMKMIRETPPIGAVNPNQVKSAISDPAFFNDYLSLKTIADDLDQKIRSGNFSIKDVNERERLLKKMQELEAQTNPQMQPATQNQPLGLLDTSYRGMHTAPNREFGAQLFELDKIYPDDIYSANAARFYGHGGDQTKIDQKTAQIVKSFRGNPDAEVTIYRAVPKDENIKEINAGDWVTINKDYAKDHGKSVLRGDYKIVEKKVKAKDIWTNADSIHEYGYDPM